uniref:Protein NLRC3-like n=1 Tax=Saccoglossus kowalevskii TaxID=10224 RepID=A0ABM0GNF2_SACKO|nr:PREDICTED: protein NLRC3-like [Saccoglossus kowalevskii]
MGCGSSANTVVNSSQPSINSNIQKPKNQQENKTILHIANKKSPSTSAHSASSDSSNISPCILGGKSTSISFSSIVNPPSTVSPIIAGDISTGSASGVAMASTSKGSIQKSTVTMVTETNEDQKRFNIALKSMCRLVKTDELYSYATQNVISLRLDRIPPNADFSLATLYSKLTNITELDISGNRLGPQGVRTAVLAMIYNDRITTFNISNNQADTDSAECIGKLIALNTTLTWLDVSSNSLGKDFFSRSVGPALQTNTSLKCLKFASCGATDLKVFFECLQKNKTLDILDMSYNYMTNGELTAQMIADILKNQECKLTSLEMKSTGIDVKGMKFLVEGLLSNKSLEIFCVGGNKMSTTGDMAGLVIAAIQHPGLVTFNMDDSRVLDKNDINISEYTESNGASGRKEGQRVGYYRLIDR